MKMVSDQRSVVSGIGTSRCVNVPTANGQRTKGKLCS